MRSIGSMVAAVPFLGRPEDDVEEYLRGFDFIAGFNKWSDGNKAGMLCMALKEEAGKWASNLASNVRTDYSLLTTALLARFGTDPQLLHLQLHQCEQRANETVQSYAERLQSCMRKCLPPASLTDTVKMSYFNAGLQPYYRERIVTARCQTMEDALELCVRLEAFSSKLGLDHHRPTRPAAVLNINTLPEQELDEYRWQDSINAMYASRINTLPSNHQPASTWSRNGSRSAPPQPVNEDLRRMLDTQTNLLGRLVETVNQISTAYNPSAGRSQPPRGGANKGRGNGNHGPGTPVQCGFCGILGHGMDECRKRAQQERYAGNFQPPYNANSYQQQQPFGGGFQQPMAYHSGAQQQWLGPSQAFQQPYGSPYQQQWGGSQHQPQYRAPPAPHQNGAGPQLQLTAGPGHFVQTPQLSAATTPHLAQNPTGNTPSTQQAGSSNPTAHQPQQPPRSSISTINTLFTACTAINTTSVYSVFRDIAIPSTPLTIPGSVDSVPIADIIVDTGAGVTAISGRVFNQLPVDKQQELNTDTMLEVRSASSNPLVLKGTVQVDIVLRGTARISNVRCLVLDNLGADCILGTDQLETQFDSISPRLRLLSYTDPHSHQVVNLRLNQQQQPSQVYSILMMKSVKLLPNTEVVVDAAGIDDLDTELVRSQAASDRDDNNCYLMEPVDLQLAGVTVARTLLSFDAVVSKATFPVRVRNNTNAKLRLKAGTTIGRLEPVTFNPSLQPPPPTPSREGIAVYTIGASTASTSPKVNSNPISAIKFELCDLSHEDLVRLKELLLEYINVFAVNPKKPSTTTVTKHYIHTSEHPPIRLPAYRVPRHHEDFIQQEIEELLRNELIEKSSSPWSFPVVVVYKKDGSKRLCIDYRRLNNITKMDGYPIPDIRDLLDCLNGAVIFSSLDLASGYWQVVLNEDDKEKTAFVTKYGFYQWKVMPFGLSTAPATFVKLMDEVLGDLKWKCVVCYFDDIVIYSKSAAEHLVHLRLVLDRLRKAGLQAKVSKCDFAQQKISFVGYVISGQGISPDPSKVAAVDAWPTPTDVTAVKSFLGLANYYRCFVRGFSKIAQPLNELTRKEEPFVWTDKRESAFQLLKTRLTSAPILVCPDFTLPFTLYTDASRFAIGAILGQMQDGRERVVSYASRTLNTHELNYSVSEKEALAIVWSVKLFRNYLLGNMPFTIITDHAPLAGLAKIKDVHGRLGRWSLTLQEYRYVIRYREGARNQADALSRINVATGDTAGMQGYSERVATPPTHISQQLLQHTASDSEPTAPIAGSTIHTLSLRSSTNTQPAPSRTSESTAAMIDNQDESDSKYPDSDSESDSDDDQHLDNSGQHTEVDDIVAFRVGDQVVVQAIGHPGPYTIADRVSPIHYELTLNEDPSIVRTVTINDMVKYHDDTSRLDEGREDDHIDIQLEKLNLEQRLDKEFSMLIAYLERAELPTDAHQAERIKRLSTDFALDNNHSLVYLVPPTRNNTNINACKRLVIPSSLRAQYLTMFHDSPLAGHLGYIKTLFKLQQRYYWPGMSVQVLNWIKSCDLCMRKKMPPAVTYPIRSILPSSTPGMSTPFSEVVVDTMGPLTRTKRGNQYIIIFGDRLTRWPEGFAVRNQRSSTVARLLINELMPRHGAPRTLLSDQGSNYLSRVCRQVYKLMSTSKLQTSAYYPQCNGLVERFNKTIINMLAMYTNERQTDWDTSINHVLFAYRTAVTASTGYSPFYMLHGYEARYPADILLNDAHLYADATEYVQNTVSNIKVAHEVAKDNLLRIDQRLANTNIHLKPSKEYKEGDLVLVYHPQGETGLSTKLLLRWKGPYKVVKRLSPLNYQVRLIVSDVKSSKKKRSLTVHIYRMRPYLVRDGVEVVDPPVQDAQ